MKISLKINFGSNLHFGLVKLLMEQKLKFATLKVDCTSRIGCATELPLVLLFPPPPPPPPPNALSCSLALRSNGSANCQEKGREGEGEVKGVEEEEEEEEEGGEEASLEVLGGKRERERESGEW